MILTCLLVLQLAGEALSARAGPPRLTTARQVHQLSAAQARLAYPVTLTAAVTYSDRTGMLFVSDASGGVYVSTLPGQAMLPFGAVVTIAGTTGAGDFAPVILARSILPTGRTTEPEIHSVSFQDLASGSEDSEWVEFRGVVRRAWVNSSTHFPELLVAEGGGKIRVQIAGMEPGTDLDSLVDAMVRVRGAVGGIFNQKRQIVAARLFVPSLAHIVIEEAAPPAPFSVPVLTAESLLQYTLRSSYGHRVRLEGTVTLSQLPGRVFIRDATQGLEIQPQTAPDVRVGDKIEILGFPAAGEWTPVLQDAVIRKTGTGPAPAPAVVTPRQALEGNFDSELVQLQARLADYVPRREAEVLVLQSGELLFNALLQNQAQRGLLADLPKGSEVRLTGICQVEVAGPAKERRSFRLLLRDRDDVRLLQRPPWWTLARILWVLLAMTIVLVLALCWVVVLRRRVQAQTQVIRQKLHQEAILEERARIAREFHDTIEQELIGIGMQLDSVRAKLKAAPELAAEGLHLAGRMIRRTIGEARRSVLDLRSRALESGDLGAALAEVAKPVVAGTPLELRVEQTGAIRRLPAPIEDNLLRIGQEAITNTVKHAGASRLLVRLDYQVDKISLRVQDDGCGFEQRTEAGAGAEHFGFLGMRERAARIGACLTVKSAPERGTEILVEAPLNLEADHHEQKQFLPGRLPG